MNHAKTLSPEEWIHYSILLAAKVDKAMAKSGGTIELLQLDAEIRLGESVAFGIFDEKTIKCLLVGKYIQYTPSLRVFFVTLGAGELMQYTSAIAELHGMVKEGGAKYVELWAGAAEARLYARAGYTPVCSVLRKPL